MLLRLTCNLSAIADYAKPMKVNPVRNCTLIIRIQVEYSRATLTVALLAELIDLQKQMTLPAQDKGKISGNLKGSSLS